MRGLWHELTDLVLPGDCAGCGLPRAPGRLCPSCRAALAGPEPRRVWPETVPAGLPAVYATADYADEVRAVLLAHKERGALALARPLGDALARAVRAALRTAPWEAVTGPVLLVPVPSARRAVASRGHDHVGRLSRAAAAALREAGAPARMLPLLRQRRTVADQAGLTARERLANLDGALERVPGGDRLSAGAVTVLVDDVMTSGASLREAARAVGDGSVTAAAVVACRTAR